MLRNNADAHISSLGYLWSRQKHTESLNDGFFPYDK